MYVGDKIEANARRGHSSTYHYKLFIASKYAFPGFFLKKFAYIKTMLSSNQPGIGERIKE